MRFSIDPCRIQKLLSLLMYRLHCILFSPVSLKTLNPWFPAPSNSLLAFAFNFYSPSGSSSIGSFCSSPLQKDSIRGNSASGSSSVSYFELYSLQQKQSLNRSSSTSTSNCFSNPYLHVKHCFLLRSSVMSSLNYQLESHPRFKMSSDSGYHHCKVLLRTFSVSCSNGELISSPLVEGEVPGVSEYRPDQQMSENGNKFPLKFKLEIIANIQKNGQDLEARLSMMASRLDIYSVTEIFEILNSRRISGLKFFEWIWGNDRQLRKNEKICSLIIDNLGRLYDYETMFELLKKFRSINICLTYEAFGFLLVLASTNSSLKQSTKRVVDLLNKVDGSCRHSGVSSLIEMFCKLDMFAMARYVIEITESKESYYCLLIREKCRRGLTEDARLIKREMVEAHCTPTTRVYNYLLSSLCKNSMVDEVYSLLDEMREIGIPSDAITFEILVNFVSSLGNMEVVHQLIDLMVSHGLEPRHQTHVSIVKALFLAEKYEAAYSYVSHSSVIHKKSSNMMYSAMANLYLQNGDVMSARKTLVEMMEKNLKPNLKVYLKTVKQLKRTGRANLARDLAGMHSKFG